jgi:hypothetical protein
MWSRKIDGFNDIFPIEPVAQEKGRTHESRRRINQQLLESLIRELRWMGLRSENLKNGQSGSDTGEETLSTCPLAGGAAGKEKQSIPVKKTAKKMVFFN